MVRTKYLVVAILSCVVLIFLVGVLSPAPSRATHDSYIGTHAVFTTPKEKYTIAGTSLDTRIEERQAFKARVQETLRAKPIVTAEEEIADEDRSITTPAEILPTSVTAVAPPVQIAPDISELPVVMDIATTGTTSVSSVVVLDEVIATTSAEDTLDDIEN